MEIWSHRCGGETNAANTVAGWIRSINIGFKGIEIDVYYIDGKFMLVHDEIDVPKATETLSDLINALPSHADWGLWIDLKVREKFLNFFIVVYGCPATLPATLTSFSCFPAVFCLYVCVYQTLNLPYSCHFHNGRSMQCRLQCPECSKSWVDPKRTQCSS